jgi:hypothetical protein
MTMAAGRMHISLQAAGTKGCAEVVRGGIGAASQHGRGFRLVKQCAGDVDPTQARHSARWGRGLPVAAAWQLLAV